MIPTEGRNPKGEKLDSMKPDAIARLVAEEGSEAAEAVWNAGADIGKAIRAVAECFQAGGTLLYVGAGTSGRIGAMDAAEMPPTFGVSQDSFKALVAGNAVSASKEGAEDDTAQALVDFESAVREGSCVVCGISASGGAAYVLEIIRAANERGFPTIGIANNPNSPLLQIAKIAILLDTGPEILAGSTRMKAGTAQKIALNAISTGAMALSGRIKGNRMSHMKPTNAKLRRRAVAMVAEQYGITPEEAEAKLEAATWSLPDAL